MIGPGYDWILCLVTMIAGGLLGVLRYTSGQIQVTASEPVPNPVPGQVWRRQLDAQLDLMTLERPFIDHSKIDVWPTPKSTDRKSELIRESLRGSVFVGSERTEVHSWGSSQPVRCDPIFHQVQGRDFLEA